MLIIDEHADSKLLSFLESAKHHPEGERCVHFKTAAYAAQMQAARGDILAAAQRNLPAEDTQIFLCEDGEMVIVGHALSTKAARSFILSVGEYVGATDLNYAEFFELDQRIHALLLQLEAKQQHKRALMRALQEDQRREAMERARHVILDIDALPKYDESIATRRQHRSSVDVMIIEDDPFIRRLVENVVGKDYHFHGMGEVRGALAAYLRIAPNMLFLDIHLPDVTGHELLTRILELDPEAYVVMLSGNADSENISKAIRLGAKGFVGKPFTREKLVQYIARCPTIRS